MNLLDHKIYVGSAKNLDERKCSHFKLQNSSKYLTNAIKKYGKKNFKFYVLEYVEDKTKLIEREQYYLNKLQPFVDMNKGYNISHTAGSPLGSKHTLAYKKKISRIVKTRWENLDYKHRLQLAHQGTKNPRFGVHLSDTTKQKISKANTGKKASLVTKNKLSLIHKGQIPWNKNKPYCIRGHRRSVENLFKDGTCKICYSIRETKSKTKKLVNVK
jgi:group I intron endonuclease